MTLKTVKKNAMVAVPGILVWIAFLSVAHPLGWMERLPSWGHFFGQAWGAFMGLLLIFGVVVPLSATHALSMTPKHEIDRFRFGGLRQLAPFFAISDWKERS